MHRRTLSLVSLLLALVAFAACSNKHVNNPLANVGSKQPDKVLFDRAMDAMKHNRFDVARMTLEALINTYPDSEYIAHAKLAVGDSFYAEGGSASFAQAEAQYKDFITFFPNMPEAAEAQYKIANIHYRQMEKADRDFTHAARAEQEYRQLILQYPDSQLVPEAKKRLLQVQEVLAEREYLIGRFYYLRDSWAAAEARLQSVVDTYPLYSGADEALYLLGQSKERQVDQLRMAKLPEAVKGQVIKKYENEAAQAYSRILTRYPATARVEDAKARLKALKYPIPQATPEMLAQNKREEASRGETGTLDKFWGTLSKKPDMNAAATVGDPTLADPKQTSATDILRAANIALAEAAAAALNVRSNNNAVSVETVKSGAPAANQPVPRSDAPPATANATGGAASSQPNSPATNADANGSNGNNTAIPELKPLPAGGDNSNAIPELKPLAPAGNSAGTSDPPAATSGAGAPNTDAPPVAPAQINQVQDGPGSKQDDAQASSDSKQNTKGNETAESSSSRSKKKKGLGRLF